MKNIISCPLCGDTSFLPTNQVFSTRDIVDRWQAEAGMVFEGSVWEGAGETDSCDIRLHTCGTCGFSMFQPPLTGSQSFYRGITEKEYYVKEKWEFFEAVKDIKRHGCQTVLDIGCGSGAFLDMLREAMPRLAASAGYELNPEVADEARKKGHTIYGGDFPDSIVTVNRDQTSFDGVCLFQVLEHVADPFNILNSIRAVLADRGIAIISVPNSAGPLRFFPNALTEIPPHHVSRWCPSSFRTAMPKLGFRIEKIMYEPLPHYLWHSYLPEVWDSNIWATFIPKCRIDPGRMRKIVTLLSFCHNHLPSLWQSRVWSAAVKSKLDQHAFDEDKIKVILEFIARVREHNMKWLWCVPGHSLYVVLRKR